MGRDLWCVFHLSLNSYNNNIFTGDLVYAPLPGQDIIILSSYEVAQDLLLRRQSSTAGRNVGYLASDLWVNFSGVGMYFGSNALV
jgi:hypothetical protein